MHLPCMTAALATLLLGAQALPTAGTSPSSPLLSKRDYTCNDYTYENDTSDASPLVSDCQQLVANIFPPADWRTDQPGFRTIASYGTCNFGVQQHTSTIVIFHVDNQDVETLINNAINSYQWNGLVGASGYMQCQDDVNDVYHDVYWSLY
jgi:hypothetical protein